MCLQDASPTWAVLPTSKRFGSPRTGKLIEGFRKLSRHLNPEPVERFELRIIRADLQRDPIREFMQFYQSPGFVGCELQFVNHRRGEWMRTITFCRLIGSSCADLTEDPEWSATHEQYRPFVFCFHTARRRGNSVELEKTHRRKRFRRSIAGSRPLPWGDFFRQTMKAKRGIPGRERRI